MNHYRREVTLADKYDDKIASQELLNGVQGDHPVAWALTVGTPKSFSKLYDKALKYAKVEEDFGAQYSGSVPNAPTGGPKVERERCPSPRAMQLQTRDCVVDKQRPLPRPYMEPSEH